MRTLGGGRHGTVGVRCDVRQDEQSREGLAKQGTWVILALMNDRSVSQNQPGHATKPTHDLPARARVVVVGGGVIGTSVAYHLAHLGVTDVVLLERHELTAGTTWHAAGLITSAGMTDETAIWMARYSRDLYSRLEAETGHSTGFREIGHLHLACNAERLETLRRERAFQRGFGIDNVEVSRGRGRRADADDPGRRRARRVVCRRRRPRRPGRGGDRAGQGRPALGRARSRPGRR